MHASRMCGAEGFFFTRLTESRTQAITKTPKDSCFVPGHRHDLPFPDRWPALADPAATSDPKSPVPKSDQGA